MISGIPFRPSQLSCAYEQPYTTGPMSNHKPCRILIWADAEQQTFVRDVQSVGGLDPVGVGSDSSVAASGLSSSLGIERIGDLRQGMQQVEADLVWIAAPVVLDDDTIRLIGKLERKVLASIPQPALLQEQSAAIKEQSLVRTGPLMRHGPGLRAAAEALAEMGPVEAVHVCFRSRARESALFARLFDAMDVVESLCGEADMIDANLAGSTGTVPESAAALHGHVTAHIRFADQRSASVFVSDCSGEWFRGVTIMAAGGCLRITDEQMAWISRETGEMDASEAVDLAPAPATLIADAVRRWHEGRDHADPPLGLARLLAMCEATRLSCRTGEGEAPRTMLKMLRHP